MFGEHEVYDSATDTWHSLEEMPTPVHGVTGLAFVDGLIHLPRGGIRTGGSSGSRIHQVNRPEMQCGPAKSPGDINLDGEFSSSELVEVFRAGEYQDQLVVNSSWAEGDWNGDREFESADLLSAFSEGGYEQGPLGATRAAPEPSGVIPVIAALLMTCLYRR